MMSVRKKMMCLLAAALFVLLAGTAMVPAATVTVANRTETLSGGTWKTKTSGGKVKFRYRKSSGKYAKNGWKKIGGDWFCMTRNGYACTGLTKVNGKYFLFSDEGGAGSAGRMLTGLHSIGGQTYFFKTSGAAGVLGSRAQSEWAVADGTEYYFRQDGTMHPQRRLSEQEFIKKVGELARADMKETGILASVTIAQAILESGYGSTSLAMEANNFFGMKASLSGNTWSSEWDGRTFAKQTQEWDGSRFITITADFRAYNDMAASIRDHSNYLRYAKNGTALRYAGVSGNKSYRKTIKLIKKGGYATDPEYVTKICNIIKKYKLTRYDK